MALTNSNACVSKKINKSYWLPKLAINNYLRFSVQICCYVNIFSANLAKKFIKMQAINFWPFGLHKLFLLDNFSKEDISAYNQKRKYFPFAWMLHLKVCCVLQHSEPGSKEARFNVCEWLWQPILGLRQLRNLSNYRRRKRENSPNLRKFERCRSEVIVDVVLYNYQVDLKSVEVVFRVFYWIIVVTTCKKKKCTIWSKKNIKLHITLNTDK